MLDIVTYALDYSGSPGPSERLEIKMKIISPFKDYYDWVAGKYGGGDPRLVYKRTKIEGKNIKDRFMRNIGYSNMYLLSALNTDRRRQGKSMYTFNVLIFCGRQYLVVEAGGVTNIFSEEKHPDLWKNLNRTSRGIASPLVNPPSIDFYLGKQTQFAENLCKRYDQPVLLLIDYLGTAVSNRIPVLQDIGFGSIMSAEQCYQEISHFLGNVLRENPDTKPPIQVDDKYKIIGAGFDTKTSFRHRK